MPASTHSAAPERTGMAPRKSVTLTAIFLGPAVSGQEVEDFEALHISTRWPRTPKPVTSVHAVAPNFCAIRAATRFDLISFPTSGRSVTSVSWSVGRYVADAKTMGSGRILYLRGHTLQCLRYPAPPGFISHAGRKQYTGTDSLGEHQYVTTAQPALHETANIWRRWTLR